MTRKQPKTVSREFVEFSKKLGSSGASFVARLSTHSGVCYVKVPRDLCQFFELEVGDHIFVVLDSVKGERPAPETRTT